MRKSTTTLATVATLLAAACGGGDGATPAVASGGTAVYCTSSLPDVLNTFVTPDITAADARWLLFTPLVRYAPDGNALAPWLATSWRWNDARTSVDIALRDDVTWHDGEVLDAADVAWTVRIAADPAFAYNGADDLAGLTEATAVAPDTVRLIFDRPVIADLEPFVHLPILPHHLLDSIPAASFAQAQWHRAPVGSGPFRYVERSVDNAILLTRNDAFPEELGRPYIDRLMLRGVPETTSALVELETGNIQACVMGSSRAEEVARSGALRAVPVPPAGLWVIPLDTRRAPLDDAHVRRALSAALERDILAAALSPAIRPARTFLPGGSRWTDSTALQPDGDTLIAGALLDEAGWRRGPDGMRTNAAGTPLRIELAAPQTLRVVLEAAQAQWRRAGIDVALRFMEGAAYIALIREPSTRPSAMALSFFPDRLLTPDPGSQLHTEGGSNLSSWSDPDVDRIVELLATPLSDADRAAAYHALQRRVAEDVPLIYVLEAPRLLAIDADIEGVTADPNGPLATVPAWRVMAPAR